MPKNTVDVKKIFVLADQALVNVVQKITDDQWNKEMPPEFMRRDKKPISLREVINYHAYDDAWVPDMLAGFTMEQAGKEKFDGDLLKEDPVENFKKLANLACIAAQHADLSTTTHLTYGDYPASEYLKHITSFRGLRAFDLAKVLGQDTRLDDELVQGMWDEFYPEAELWRTMGVFGPKVEVREDAPLQDKLLGLTGRQPR